MVTAQEIDDIWDNNYKSKQEVKMVKKKVLKVLLGEAYDKDTNKNYPVYRSYWQQDDGSYQRIEKVFVNEVDLPDKKPENKSKVDA